jgi:hypothetical protein
MLFYYTENESKRQIIENRNKAIVLPDPCYLYYHDKEFSKIDWLQEPRKSLDELYLERALQIRSEYEYLILSFSGGADSTNVLETFYNNNIHIDEILIVGAFSQDAYVNSDDNHNGEIYLSALPILNQLKLHNTKITSFDYTKLFNNINNFSLIQKYGTDWVDHIGSFYSVHTLFWNDLKKFIGQDNDKKTAVIFGIEKPFLIYDYITDESYTYFSDIALCSYGNFQKDQNFERVNFYTSPQTIDLMRKQLHTIHNFLSENMHKTKTIPQYFWDTYKTDIVHKLVYNRKEKLSFVSPKSPGNVISLRDRYILNNKNEDIYNIFYDGIKKIPKLKNKIGEFRTKRYYISKRK